MKKAVFFIVLLSFPSVLLASETCVSLDRAGWPAKYQKSSVAGAVSLVAADDGIEPFLQPSGRVEQRGFNQVCVSNPNPAFDFRKVTPAALLKKMQDNDLLDQQAQADIEAKVSAFDALTDTEKVELIKTKLREKEPK